MLGNAWVCWAGLDIGAACRLVDNIESNGGCKEGTNIGESVALPAIYFEQKLSVQLYTL